MHEKLKAGILLNNRFLPAWEHRIIKVLNDSEFVQIVLVIKNKSENSSGIKREWGLTHSLIKLIELIDRAIFKTRNDYNLKMDVSGLFKDISEIVINPGENSSNESFSKQDINKIKSFNLDIIIKFGFHILKGDILKIPKYGVWAYSIDDNKIINAIDSGFWEVVRNQPLTSSALGILKQDKEEMEIIFSSYESTYPISVNVNRNKLFWRASLFLPRILNGLYEHGENHLTALSNRFKSIKINKDRFSDTPSFINTVNNVLSYFAITTKNICKKIFYTDAFNWELLFEIKNGKESVNLNFSSFQKVRHSKEFFWADPFVVAENDSYYIFVEEFIHKTNKAHISVLRLDNNGNLLSSSKIIERPYHMSYPFIFKINGTYFMIPETCHNKTIELYKCIDFPYKWEFEKNIMENLNAVDTTLFFYKNKWWLFTAIDQTDNIAGCSTELFLFYTDEIFSGEWISHPGNPIVSDARRARPAGKIFIQEGKIYRPSQDCSTRYGKGFNLNHVTKLTASEYDEEVVTYVEPTWDKRLKGTHTFNFDKDFTIIDVYSYRRRDFRIIKQLSI